MILNSRSVSRSTSLYPEFLNSPMYSGVIPSDLKVTRSFGFRSKPAAFMSAAYSGSSLMAVNVIRS